MRCGIVVGYQNLLLNDQQTSGGFTYLVSTLPSVGKDQTKLTLNDLTVVPPETGLMGPDSVNIHTYNDIGQESGNYSYVDDVAIGMYYWTDEGGSLITPGWYTYDSLQGYTDFPVPCGDTILAFGEGFMVISDCGAQITCAGEVLQNGKDLPLNDQATSGGFTYIGNCSPVDVELKDIAITPPETGLMGPDSVNIHTYNDIGQESGNYSYVDDVAIGMYYWTDEGGNLITPGWYTYDSLQGYTDFPVPCGTTKILAGQMFMSISDCGAVLTIPSAL